MNVPIDVLVQLAVSLNICVAAEALEVQARK